MKVYEGPGMIADKAGAMVVPIRIDGAQYTPFSRLQGQGPLRWFPQDPDHRAAGARLEVAEA